jgi:hypothetical protein
MIKPRKVCSQLMNANNTVKTNIEVVAKYFLTYICFLFFKNSSKFIFELIANSKFILVFSKL